MTLPRSSTGPAILQLQRSLLALGYPLPRYGADGWLGDETLTALALLLHAHGHELAEVPGEVTDADLELVARLVRERAAPPPGLVDVRHIAPRTIVVGRIPWTSIAGITLHQTASALGERPERWSTIGAHVGVTRGGKPIWMHDFTSFVWHANHLSYSTIGIECDGMLEGVEGRPETLWRPKSEPNRQPQRPTPAQEGSARAAIRWIVAEVARHGGKVRHLYAHRQASADRQSDPGSALWQRVAMPMHAELGLDAGPPGYRVGTGLGIPAEWDSERRGVRY